MVLPAEEQSMAADSKNTRAQSRLEKAAREDERPKTKAAAPAVRHEESEAEHSKGA